MTEKNEIEGKKYDEGKLPYDLLPPEAVEEVVRVLQFGADRYGRNNWKHLQNATDRYYAATMRHIQKWRKGQQIDSDSGLPHLAHAICSLIFLLELERSDSE